LTLLKTSILSVYANNLELIDLDCPVNQVLKFKDGGQDCLRNTALKKLTGIWRRPIIWDNLNSIDSYLNVKVMIGEFQPKFYFTKEPKICRAKIFVSPSFSSERSNKSAKEFCEKEISQDSKNPCECESINEISKEYTKQEFEKYTLDIVKNIYDKNPEKLRSFIDSSSLEQLAKSEFADIFELEKSVNRKRQPEIQELKNKLSKDVFNFQMIKEKEDKLTDKKISVKDQDARTINLRKAFPELELQNYLNYIPNYLGPIHFKKYPPVELATKENLFKDFNKSLPIPKEEQWYLLELAKEYLKNQNFKEAHNALKMVQDSIDLYGPNNAQIKFIDPLVNTLGQSCILPDYPNCTSPYGLPIINIESEVHYLHGLIALQLGDSNTAVIHLKISKKLLDYAAVDKKIEPFNNNKSIENYRNLIESKAKEEKNSGYVRDEFLDSFKSDTYLGNYRIAIPLSIALYQIGKFYESNELLEFIKIYQNQIDFQAPKKSASFYFPLKNSLSSSLLEVYLGQNDFKNANYLIKTFDSSFLTERTLDGLSNSARAILDLITSRGRNSSYFLQKSLESTGKALSAATLNTKDSSYRFLKMHLLVEENDITSSKILIDELINDAEIQSNKGIYWQILNDAGRIAYRENKYEEAEKFFRKSIQEIEKQRESISSELSRISFFGNRQKPYQELIKLLIAQGQIEKAFLVSEQIRSRTLIDILSQKNYLEEIYQSSESNNKRSLIEDLSVNKISISDIQSKLSNNVTVISYYYDNEKFYAFLLGKNSIELVPLHRKNIEEDIQAFGKLIEADSDSINNAAEKLYLRLFSPLKDKLKENNLIIIKYGVLHYVPFAALKNNNTFLIDEFKINYLPSSALMVNNGMNKIAHGQSILALGNPNIGNSKYELPYAEEEVKELGRLFKNSKILIKDNASKENLLKFGNDYRYIHIASHGKFIEENPMESGLMLAGQSFIDSSDRLTVKDLYSIKLNADLVTLSACETGLGKVTSGDDVLGLVRGFMFAGAKNIISTLWAIDDEATKKLMVVFYKQLNSGATHSVALRIAQLQLKKEYPNPKYWAAFELTGSP